MQKYESLIFDLDDTLIDNNQSIMYAFRVMLENTGIPYSNELFEKWKRNDTAYWHTWESGQMIIPDTIKTLDDKITYLRANRFILFFKKLGIEIDFETAIKLNDIYCSMLGVNIVPIEGANQLLGDLNTSYQIYIATNGPKKAAINKIEKAKLDSYISSIVCSEEVGYSKPKQEFFEYLFNKMQNKDRERMLLIGDSLTTDILGGMNNGIDTCWFNPGGVEVPEEYKPTMTVNKLLELKKKL